MMKKIISFILITISALILVFSCEGCSKQGVTEPQDDRLKVRNYYNKMTDVQPLNWCDFDEVFVYIESEHQWVFKIQPRFPDLTSSYEWEYDGEKTTFSLYNGFNDYKRDNRIFTNNNYVVTFVPQDNYSTYKYMIYGKFRGSTHFLYTFRIDWNKRITIPDGGITFTYPTTFESGWYWFDYTENRIPTILEWRNII